MTSILKRLFSPPKPPEREWLLWVGDGMSPAGPDLVGRPVELDGKKGKVVDTTLLKILVEWEKQP